MSDQDEPRIPRYEHASYVNPQITDGVTQSNVTTVSHSPGVSAMQAYLSLSQAQGVLFANMVNNQQQLAMASQVAVVESIIQLFGLNERKGGGDGSLVRESIGQASASPVSTLSVD